MISGVCMEVPTFERRYMHFILILRKKRTGSTTNGFGPFILMMEENDRVLYLMVFTFILTLGY